MPARDRLPVLRAAAIVAGGAVGALVRGGLVEVWPAGGGSWPWGTFTANVAGTVVLATVVGRLSGRDRSPELWRALLGTGFAGALTTFSAFQIEAVDLARQGRPGLAAAYVTLSLALGLVLASAVGAGARRRPPA